MNPTGRLIEEDRSSRKRILVVGDAMTDVYLHGRLEECQEGCPKFVIDPARTVKVPGGAANAARSLQYWNAGVVLATGRPHACPVKTRFMAGGECVFRHDDDRKDPEVDDARALALNVLRNNPPAAVLLSDYDKGLLEPDFIRTITDLCASHGIPCVADAKREPGLYRGALLKCNAAYALEYQNYLQNTEAAAVVTRGAVSPVIWCGPWLEELPDLPPVECVNHVGAGDCFAAHLALALAHGFSLAEAAEIAHAAGRAYVQAPHNAPPTPAAVAAAAYGRVYSCR